LFLGHPNTPKSRKSSARRALPAKQHRCAKMQRRHRFAGTDGRASD
jgi:hypothetical protein